MNTWNNLQLNYYAYENITWHNRNKSLSNDDFIFKKQLNYLLPSLMPRKQQNEQNFNYETTVIDSVKNPNLSQQCLIKLLILIVIIALISIGISFIPYENLEGIY